MAGTPNPWEEFLKIEETHGRLLDSMAYILRECGGLVWPLLYACLLYCGWNALGSVMKSVFLLLGFILTGIAVLYPYAWKKYYKRLYSDYEVMVKKRVQVILDMIKRDDIGTYYVWTKQIQSLIDSLQNFDDKYFPKKEKD